MLLYYETILFRKIKSEQKIETKDKSQSRKYFIMAFFELLVLYFQQAVSACILLSAFAFVLSWIVVGLYVLHVHAIGKTGQDDLTSENICEGDAIYIQTRETALGPMSRLEFHAVNFADVRIVFEDILNRRGNHEHVQLPSFEGPDIWVWTREDDGSTYRLKNMVTGIELVFERKIMENEDVWDHIRNAWRVVSSGFMLCFLTTYVDRPSVGLLRRGTLHNVAMLHRDVDESTERRSIIGDMELVGIVDKDRLKKLN